MSLSCKLFIIDVPIFNSCAYLKMIKKNYSTMFDKKKKGPNSKIKSLVQFFFN